MKFLAVVGLVGAINYVGFSYFGAIVNGNIDTYRGRDIAPLSGGDGCQFIEDFYGTEFKNNC